ncbi:cysteine-rich receptor-like protein kinase [Trifolium medium]|uniref:Cysteine-rich receptor-like protein kinase n=1 Tax=Trifolium medium TaxID=97028 RepID=A0A392M0E6_9FABA|nr:cysteine-rich receptor-like protein kinase [Trifolium medium]
MAKSKKVPKAFRLVWHMVIWIIWKARNNFIFNNVVKEPSDLVEEVKVFASGCLAVVWFGCYGTFWSTCFACSSATVRPLLLSGSCFYLLGGSAPFFATAFAR